MAAFPRGSSFKQKKDVKVSKNKNRFRQARSAIKRKADTKAKTSFSFKKQKQDVAEELLDKMKIFHLRMKNLHEGMLFLAIVKDIIGNSFLICSNQDIVFVLKKNQCNISIGDLLPCKVLESLGNDTFKVSYEPSDINKNIIWNNFPIGGTVYGRVKSKEDHGYLIDLGKASFQAFLPDTNCESTFKPGDLKYFYLKDRSSKVIKLSEFKKPILSVEYNSFQNLLPGTYVKANKISQLDGGICVRFGGNYLGSITNEHYDVSLEDEFQARIVSVNDLDKTVTLTTLHNQTECDFDYDNFLQMKGKRIVEARIERIIANRGVLVEANGISGFLPEKRTDDNFPIKNMKEDDIIEVRCYETNPFDHLLLFSSEQHIIESDVFAPDEVYAGLITSGTIHKICDFGIIINFCLGLQGLVPLNQLSDILTNPFKKYSNGDKVVCRVVSAKFDEDERKYKFVLSMKKSIIRSKLPIIAHPSDIRSGIITHGVVTKATDKKLFITFYNQQYGIVPQNDLSNFGVKNVKQSYHVGQTVRVRVVASLPGGALDLSLKTSLDKNSVPVGTSDTCKVISKQNNGFKVELLQHKAIAFLPFEQLCESSSIKEAVVQGLHTDHTLEVIVIVNHGRLVVSAKKSIQKFSKAALESLTSTFVGWISKVDDTYVVVDFLSRKDESIIFNESAVIYRNNLSVLSLRSKSLTQLYTSGQTVLISENGKHKNGNQLYTLSEESISLDTKVLDTLSHSFLLDFTRIMHFEDETNDIFIGQTIEVSVIRKTSDKALLLCKKYSNKRFAIYKKTYLEDLMFNNLQVHEKFVATVVGYNRLTKEYFLVYSIENFPGSIVLYVDEAMIVVYSDNTFCLAWTSFNGLNLQDIISVGASCEIESLSRKKLKGFWKNCKLCTLTLLDQKLFPSIFLKGVENVKAEIAVDVKVRFRLLDVHNPRGVVSIVLLNIRRNTKFKTNTFIGISITDLVKADGSLPEGFKHPFETLRTGSISEGKIIDVFEQDDIVRNKIMIKPSYMMESLADAQMTVSEKDQVIGICTGVSRDGVVLQLNRKVTGTIGFAALTDDLNLLNSLEEYDDQEAKLQVLGFKLYEQVPLIVLEKVSDNAYEVHRVTVK